MEAEGPFICFKCSAEFSSMKGRAEHQRRKRKGKVEGCFVTGKKKTKSADPCDVEPPSSPLAWSDVSSNFNLENHDFGPSYNSGDFNAGKNEYLLPENDISVLLFNFKKANSDDLRGTLSPHPDGNGAVAVTLPSIAFVHGKVRAGVRTVLAHKQFDKEAKEKTPKTIWLARLYRDGLVEKVTVKPDQSNCLVAHKCEASRCAQSCTYLKRSILFHHQQVLLAIEFVETKRVGRIPWLKFAEGHLRRLKTQDRSGFFSFIDYLCSSEFSAPITEMLGQFKESMDLPMDALEQAPHPHHSQPSSSLQVPVAALERGQAKLSNREARRKAKK